MAIFARTKQASRPTVGLVLGGGGARGFVQVGALKAFKESNIDFDLCVGTSVGSIVGALYCAGVDYDDIEDAARELEMGSLHGLWLFKPADPRRIGELIRPLVGDALIQYMPKRYAAVATDIKTGKAVVLDRGSVLDAVSASSAVPVIYSPMNIDGANLSDGGLVNNIPADVCRMLGADKVVTVDAHGTRGSGTDGTGLLDMLKATLSIMSANASAMGLLQSDIVIAPDTSEFSATSKTGYQKMIELGYTATMERIEEIQALFAANG